MPSLRAASASSNVLVSFLSSTSDCAMRSLVAKSGALDNYVLVSPQFFTFRISVYAFEMPIIHTVHEQRISTSYTGLLCEGWSQSERKLGLRSRKPSCLPYCILPLCFSACSDVAGKDVIHSRL